MDNSDDVQLAESALGNPYFFTGREFDPESGLYYYRARYYDSSTGTFLQEDPFRGVLHKPDTQHPYTYARNAPTRFIDPTGQASFATLIAGLILVGGVMTVIFKTGTRRLKRQEELGQQMESTTGFDQVEQFEESRKETGDAAKELEIETNILAICGMAGDSSSAAGAIAVQASSEIVEAVHEDPVPASTQ